MSNKVSSCGPCSTTSCDVFDSAIVIPGPSFFAVHVENVYKFRSKPGELLFKFRLYDAGSIQVPVHRDQQIGKPG